MIEPDFTVSEGPAEVAAEQVVGVLGEDRLPHVRRKDVVICLSNSLRIGI